MIRKFRETTLSVGADFQNAGPRIARKLWRQPHNRFACPFAYLTSAYRFVPLEFRQSALETGSIELIDRKYSNAALGASGAADQPLAAAPRGVGESGVNDLNQLTVFRGWKGVAHYDA
jgi:hypothetical protein